MTIPASARAHWRTLVGVAIGAILGGSYAHFIGCRTGACLLTGNVWIAAAFFGFTGGVVGFPGSSRRPGTSAEHGEAPPR